MTEDLVAVRVSLQGDVCRGPILEDPELRFLERTFALSGCFIQIDDEVRPTVAIELLPSHIFEE
jgi:hypothetical protein